ncbi:MAG: ferritin [Cyanobacteria bacterium]|nr:ferritin [Cyanobacteria bacterium bin.51]
MVSDVIQTSKALGTGGRAVAQPLEEALLDGFQQHLSMELNASSAYWALAIWFAEREFRGFSLYFKQESDQERGHAGIFADYLVGRGQPVALDAIDKPRQIWESLEEVFAAVFQIETEVTTSLQQLYSLAERSGDVRTTVFLDPLIEKQTGAEAESAHLLGRLRLCDNNPAALLLLDGELFAGQSSPASMGS